MPVITLAKIYGESRNGPFPDRMRKFTYLSYATKKPSDADLIDLLKVSRDRNRRLGVTGMLIYSRQGFLQIIEGEHDDIAAVYASICRDPRHGGIRKIVDQKITRRRFSLWTMGFAHPDEEWLRLNVPGYVPYGGPFAPFAGVQQARQGAEALLVKASQTLNNGGRS